MTWTSKTLIGRQSRQQIGAETFCLRPCRISGFFAAVPFLKPLTGLVLAGGKKNVNHVIEYPKPVIVDLGSLMEVIRGTLIKGHRGIIEAIHCRVLPAYDLDE